MGTSGTTLGEATTDGTSARATTEARLSCGGQRHAVRGKDGVPMAVFTEGLSALANGIWLFSALATRRTLGKSHEGVARRGTGESGAKQRTLRRHPRFTLDQECRKRGQRGYDAGKKTKGRKQHIAVDTMGFILTVVIHSAGIQDRVGARAVLIRLFCQIPGIQKIFADGGYTGKLIAWTTAMFATTIEIVKRNDSGKFVVLPKRWIVERTFAWLALSRRLNRDYEINPRQSEAMVQLAMIRLLLMRLV